MGTSHVVSAPARPTVQGISDPVLSSAECGFKCFSWARLHREAIQARQRQMTRQVTRMTHASRFRAPSIPIESTASIWTWMATMALCTAHSEHWRWRAHAR